MPRVYYNRRNTAYYEYEVDAASCDAVQQLCNGFGPLVQLLAGSKHPTAKQVRDLCYVERRKHSGLDEVFNAPGPNGWPPLVLAVQRGHTAAVEALLELGADHECQDPKSGWTPLMFAVSLGDQATTKVLLSKVEDANKFVAPHDWNPLCVAIHAGRPEMVDTLTDAGADIKLIKRRHPNLAETYASEFEQRKAVGVPRKIVGDEHPYVRDYHLYL